MKEPYITVYDCIFFSMLSINKMKAINQLTVITLNASRQRTVLPAIDH